MKVSYCFNQNVGNYYFGKNHPMKPHRTAIVDTLINSYGLEKHMHILNPLVTEIDTYHPKDNEMIFNDDCPYFPGLESFCSEYTTNSLTAATSLLEYDISINWSGGMHHGKKREPSGFCYRNDIVIAIQRLLNFFEKVLYIDIDIHHGDAVEEAFGFDPRVMTCSFHKYGDNFFPGTGNLLSNHYSEIDFKNSSNLSDNIIQNKNNILEYNLNKNILESNLSDNIIGNKNNILESNEYLTGSNLNNDILNHTFIGNNKIKNVINVPLKSGIDDWSYKYIYEPVVTHIMRKFNPNVIVLQCGADSLGEDRLGCFNLSVQGHGECVKFIKSFNKKLLILGGGGYTPNNVARAWTYETSILTGQEIPSEIPDNPYKEYFLPNNSLFPDFKRRHENENTKRYLDSISKYIHNILDYS